ncbi:MAG: CBS domain-containing protein [Burkholderiales bacterium]|nr:CBS domain-containing protein [Burkholderiales bacterium]
MAAAPSAQILSGVKAFLSEHPPFSQLTAQELDGVARAVTLRYFEPRQRIIGPEEGSPRALFIIKQGLIGVERNAETGGTAGSGNAVSSLGAGDCFPVGALLAERAVMNTYRAAGDVFAFELPRDLFNRLAQSNPQFLAFCKRRLGALLDLSQAQTRSAYASEASYAQTLHLPLAHLVRRAALTCSPDTSIEQALMLMQQRGVGSILVVKEQASAPVVGILTRTDLITKIVLPRLPLDQPISSVMSQPVMTLQANDTAADAAMLMASHALRHVPVLDQQQLIGVVSERDLFSLQRLSLRGIGDAIRHAGSVTGLVSASADVRTLSRNLVAQGVGAAQVTALISHLNDRLTQRLITLLAHEHSMDVSQFCWIALGSEGREEQTIATDQDNAIVLADDCSMDQDKVLDFALAVNQALAELGFPLCKGQIMASNRSWCLKASAWAQLFADWIAQGDPQQLLHAAIFFDFRALAGQTSLVAPLREKVAHRAMSTPRFLKQMADNALRNRPPAAWAGDWLEALLNSEKEPVDLKLHGTVPLVDAARIFALSSQITVTSTAQRLRACVAAGRLPQTDAEAWSDAFHYLQLLRLRHQHSRSTSLTEENPNLIDPKHLSALDRRLLKESLRQARKAQQRLELDYPG